MKKKFDVEFLDEALKFIEDLDDKSRKKIIYNIDKSSYRNDPKLFKKLKGEIWEFRTLYASKQYRLFAFWDKSDNKNVLVISTHGIIKKTGKVNEREFNKAEQLRIKYFRNK